MKDVGWTRQEDFKAGAPSNKIILYYCILREIQRELREYKVK